MAAPKKVPTRTRKTGAKRNVASKKTGAKSRGVSKPQKKLKPAKKNTFIKENPVSLPRSVSLSLLNPFRLPINPDQFAIGTARYAGIFFVLVGGLFTMMHVNYIASSELITSIAPASQLAALWPTENFDFDYRDSLNNQDPPWGGVMNIYFYSQYANEVKLEIKDLDGNWTTIGQMDYLGGGDWFKQWDSTQGYDGTYTAGARMTSTNYGSKFYQNSFVVYNNNPAPTEVDATPDVTFENDASTPATDNVQLYFSVDNATALTVYAINQETNAITNLGSATQAAGSNYDWQYTWNTTSIADGPYKIKAVVTNEHGTYDQTDTTAINVENTPVTPTLALPTFSVFKTTASQPVAGTIRFDAKLTELAETVELFVAPSGSTNYVSLGQMTAKGQYDWEYNWNSKTKADGTYSFKAKATNTTGGSEATPVSVVVLNTTESTESTDFTDTTDTSTTETVSNDVVIELNVRESNPVSGGVAIEAAAVNATAAKLFIRSKGTTQKLYLADMRKENSTTWTYDWDSKSKQDGEYELFVGMTIAGVVHEKGPVRLVVKNEGVAEEAVEKVTEETSEEQMEKQVDYTTTFEISGDRPLSGTRTFTTKAKNAKFVEVFRSPRNSTIKQFMGLAKKGSDNTWSLSYDTKQAPNGDYVFYANVQFEAKAVKTSSVFAKISNVVVKEEPATDNVVRDPVQAVQSEPVKETSLDFRESTESFDEPISEEVVVSTKEILAEYEEDLARLFSKLSIAVRNRDEEAVSAVKDEIRKLKEQIIASALTRSQSEDILYQIEQKLAFDIQDLEERVVKGEEIVRDRTEEEVGKDTDGDGVTDFDEINIYNTNPNLADTDGDGFLDGSEIIGGFDPSNPSSEALIAYESPQETGIVREDILEVTTLATIEESEGDLQQTTEKVEKRPKALIAGRALPNSFVSIYVFSTPVIVTVRTDETGSWSYEFDKELEDGEHEVYVGVTDNAGKIVAKSEPFRFVKEAQAFTPIDASTAGVVTQTPPNTNVFASQSFILAVMSISVVCIGLVLIMIGLHLSRNRKEHLVAPDMQTPQVV